MTDTLAPPPDGAPRSELWARYCGVLGVDPAVADPSAGFGNTSLGVVEAETLRRVNWSDLQADGEDVVSNLDEGQFCALEPVPKDQWPTR